MNRLLALWCRFAGHRYAWFTVSYTSGRTEDVTACARCGKRINTL